MVNSHSKMLRLLFISLIGTILPISVHGDIDCSKPPPMTHLNGGYPTCCEVVKWTQTSLERKCFQHASAACKFACVFHDAEIMDDNGVINETNMKKTFEAELRLEPDYLPIAINTFNGCYSLAKEAAGGKQKDSCSLVPLLTVDCIDRHIFAKCSPGKWKTSPTCEEIKSFVQKCPLMPV